MENFDGADLSRNIIFTKRLVEKKKGDMRPYIRFLLRVRVKE
jgi:hypothetical protein